MNQTWPNWNTDQHSVGGSGSRCPHTINTFSFRRRSLSLLNLQTFKCYLVQRAAMRKNLYVSSVIFLRYYKPEPNVNISGRAYRKIGYKDFDLWLLKLVLLDELFVITRLSAACPHNGKKSAFPLPSCHVTLY